MSQAKVPKPLSGNLTIAPNSDLTVAIGRTSPDGLKDDTVAPSDTAAATPAAARPSSDTEETIPPNDSPAAKAAARIGGTDETIAPAGTSASPPGATVDLPPRGLGLNATIDSIRSLSLPAKSGSPAAAPRPQVEGYTILSELGRGGMGVVYKARQKKLNRIVALKMVLAGAHAGQEQLARFYTEAEAVAHLQQPNIVQIYEVGEHEGLPYFSLEFVDGGSLSQRIDGKPQPVSETATMVELLARAMAYAHERGIVHRDLKPANVLLTKDGQPKITDFGLAKRLESDASQTRSGTLMGTPNYMAPEQARGLVREVGPLADVYALGVILYEMLVGRTPFLGASILDTLQQVRNQEPVPPSRLQPKVPRDLETICLKCLEKEPPKRYDSSAALADDLHRFLAGEPILARPVGAPERIWRWCQRNRRVAALSAAVLLLLVSLAVGGPVAAILIGQQKSLAVQNERLAKAAQVAAEANERKAVANEQQAVAARKEADENARSAAEQRGLALDALGSLISTVQNKLRGTPATQRLRQELLQIGVDGLRRVAKSAQTAHVADTMMAEAHQRMGDVFQGVGQHTEARQQYEQSHAIRLALVESDPDQAVAQRNLALSFSKLGDISKLEGNTALARQHYSEALKLREALADKDEESATSQLDLATSYVTLGNVSEPEQAQRYYNQALKIRQALAAGSTDEESRANRERDVWITFNRLAEVSLRLKDAAAARQYYEQALVQAARLHELRQGETQVKTDLAQAHENMGNVQMQLGEFQPARESYRKALALLRPLAQEDAQNNMLQANFMLMLARAGEHIEAANKAEEFRARAPQIFGNLYNVACCYGLCAAAIDRETKSEQPGGDEKALRQDYADKAIGALRQAIGLGLRSKQGIATDHDLDAIRTHPEYEKLLDGIR